MEGSWQKFKVQLWRMFVGRDGAWKCPWQWSWCLTPQPQESVGLLSPCMDWKRKQAQPSTTPTFVWAQTPSCPGWTLECPPQPGDEVRQSRRAWAAASAARAGSGEARLWYPCRGGKGAVVALEAILQQLSEGLWSYGQNTSGCWAGRCRALPQCSELPSWQSSLQRLSNRRNSDCATAAIRRDNFGL